ncbi:uncharacterized protein [Clinocottus analis]|uniref:uncharacterized protein isoform X2 n=1 Tax=Clinocottus analis TaxID=304258 RepID=UPI0035C0E509
METQTNTQWPHTSQLISVPHKDTMRLLEVYVKRSISLNDGCQGGKKDRGREKWVTMPRKLRRHSSDPSFHLANGLKNGEIRTFSAVKPERPETHPEESEKPVKSKKKKSKKPSLWKSFLGIFSRKDIDEKDDEQDGTPEITEASSEAEASETVDGCVPTMAVNSQRKKSLRRKSMRRRFSKRRISLTKSNKAGRDLNPADITRVQAVSVESTDYYYEKVTEELEKIVHEVQVNEEVERLSDAEVIDRIIALTKEEGDAIDDKKLADAYLETEASPTHNPPTVLPTAPELVKLAFTLDFTARIAGLSKQNIGHITGLGYRYLHDRFEYQQACTDHPVSDCDN